MGRLTREPQDVPLDSVSADDHTRGLVEGLEHRSLLDVQLEIRPGIARDQRPLRLRHAIERDAILLKRIHEANAGLVRQVPNGIRREAAARAGGPQQAPRESRALFVGEVDDGERDRPITLLELAQRFDSREDAERPVEPAAVRNRIQVPADDHRACGLARQGDPVVAGGVPLLAEPEPGGDAVQPATCLTPNRPPGDPLRP